MALRALGLLDVRRVAEVAAAFVVGSAPSLSLARTARPMPIDGAVEILARQRMPTKAMRLPGVRSRIRLATHQVLAAGDQLKMCRVAASPYPATVVKLQHAHVGQGADKEMIREAMGAGIFPVVADHTIAFRIQMSPPQPASICASRLVNA